MPSLALQVVSKLQTVLLVATLLHIPSSLGLPRNISIDDSSPQITYVGAWTRAQDGTEGGHQVTSSSTAYAELRFRGTAVYIMSPKWSYPVGTAISIDGRIPTLVDLQDHAYTGAGSSSAVSGSVEVAAFVDFSNTDHILRFSVRTDLPFAIVDHIIYTVDDDEPASSSTSSIFTPSTLGNPSSSSLVNTSPEPSLATKTDSQTTTSSIGSPPSQGTTTNGQIQNSSSTVAIVCGAVGGAILVLLAIAIILFCRRKRRRRQTELPFVAIDTTPTVPPSPPYPLPFPSYSNSPSIGSMYELNHEKPSPRLQTSFSSFGYENGYHRHGHAGIQSANSTMHGSTHSPSPSQWGVSGSQGSRLTPGHINTTVPEEREIIWQSTNSQMPRDAATFGTNTALNTSLPASHTTVLPPVYSPLQENTPQPSRTLKPGPPPNTAPALMLVGSLPPEYQSVIRDGAQSHLANAGGLDQASWPIDKKTHYS